MTAGKSFLSSIILANKRTRSRSDSGSSVEMKQKFARKTGEKGSTLSGKIYLFPRLGNNIDDFQSKQ